MRHCCNLTEQLDIPEHARKIVLVGNPNAGKSVVFNALTGAYVDVSNFPGTTVDVSYATVGKDVIIDTPGVYGVSSFNDEEKVARDVILEADIIVNVVNALHLERDLFLTLQLIDMGIPLVIALNMSDEATRYGLEIDHEHLSRLLGVPVIPTVAVQGTGLKELKQSVGRATVGQSEPALEARIAAMSKKVQNRREALLVLEDDPDILARHGLTAPGSQARLYEKRRERVNRITSQVVREKARATGFSITLGRLMIRPTTGVPILLVILYLMYQVIGIFVAGTVVGITEEVIMQGYYEPAVRSILGQVIDPATPVGILLFGEFGLLTMTVTYLLGLLLPLVIGFYFLLSLMEDSGYLPRLATLVDRVFSSLGLNGRAIIPVILGLGCVTMATITTRILSSRRERTIATMLLALSVPCSAQLGVIIAMLGETGPVLAAVYVVVIAGVFGLVGKMLNRMLPGESSDLLIDLPPLRLPRLENVVKKTVIKSTMFLREAAPLFMLGALLIGTLQVTGLLVELQRFAAPLIEGWLQLPRESATAFVMGVVRRDFGAAGLYDIAMTPPQTVVSLITLTLFVPCIASLIMVLKERSIAEGLTIVIACFSIAFLVGGIVSQLLI